jgi:hypothetical protein
MDAKLRSFEEALVRQHVRGSLTGLDDEERSCPESVAAQLRTRGL